MVYENVSPEELSTRYLEVTAWNYEGYNRNHTLGGVLLNLAGKKVYVYPFTGILHILLEYRKIYESQKFDIVFRGCRIPNVFLSNIFWPIGPSSWGEIMKYRPEIPQSVHIYI
jgi:hypothetical protein